MKYDKSHPFLRIRDFLTSAGILFLIFFSLACEREPFLNGNVRIENVSTETPAKDEVIVSISVRNNNNFRGKVVAAAEVNCGTVTWLEKKANITFDPSSVAIAVIRFKGIKDRIPTMAKDFFLQTRLYNASGKIIHETDKIKKNKLHGYPD